ARRLAPLSAVALVVLLVVLFTAGPVTANVALTLVSTDPFTNTTSQHQTEVEPDTFVNGSTIVSAFQVGRFFDGGSSDIGFATSTNGGASWTNGFLPGITKFQGGGTFDRTSDPAVAFDAAHNVWMISSLGITESGGVRAIAVLTSRSTDGGLTWSNPVTTATGTNLDKNWIVCDNTASSPFFGHCYTEFDDPNDSDRLKMSTSTNGGTAWGAALNTGDNATGLGGQPVVRPNGTVIVPYANAGETQIRSFRSVDGGASWRSTVPVSAVTRHTVAGGLRTGPLPSAEIDSAGTVYVVWQDARFVSGGTRNDIVMSKSTSETTWGPVTRVTSDGADHFIPGIGVDKSTAGATARVAITYYDYTTPSCMAPNCQLNVASVTSTNGGSTWSAPLQLAGPMTLSWLANTNQGRMVGDYVSTSIPSGANAFSVFAVATAPTGTTFHENMDVPTGGVPVTGGAIRAARTPRFRGAGGGGAPAAPGAARPPLLSR
ncbi:MAG TPA: sialidase family protein, partial [Actinomycetota bacterium]